MNTFVPSTANLEAPRGLKPTSVGWQPHGKHRLAVKLNIRQMAIGEEHIQSVHYRILGVRFERGDPSY